MKTYIFILLLLAGHKGLSQGKEGFQVVITHENDFLSFGNKDENYTGGLKVETLFKEIKTKPSPFIKYCGENVLNISRIGIGATVYTPQDLVSTAPVTNDRPYSSLVFLNIGNNSYNMDRKEMIQSDLIIGLTGTSIPGNAQAYLHENHWFGSQRPIPRGWDNQIGYNGSFILNYNLRFQKTIWTTNDSDAAFKWLIINSMAKADLGNYMVNLQGGLKLNVINLNSGLLQDNYPNLPTLTKNEGSKKGIRLNFFTEPSFRIVGYNTTLEGLMFNDKSAYTIHHSNVKRLLFEINTGCNLLINDFLYLRYCHSGRTREYDNGKSFHNWGAVTIGISPSYWNYR